MTGRSIEWGVSWNPVKGKCSHDCEYCYMKSYFKRFNLDPRLRLDEKVLARPPKAERIFVCSSLDLFAEEIPSIWISRVLEKAMECRDRKFFFLTKKPARYYQLTEDIGPNIWYGTTWDGLPFTTDNIDRLIDSTPLWANLFVSFEPMLAEPKAYDIANIHYLNWVIIGADSRPGAKKPPREWADKILDFAREMGVPVFVKSNYGYPEVIQEFPK